MLVDFSSSVECNVCTPHAFSGRLTTPAALVVLRSIVLTVGRSVYLGPNKHVHVRKKMLMV